MLRLLLFCLTSLICSPLFAQSKPSNGYLLGTVTKDGQNPIDNVLVILEHGSGFYEGHTNAQGKFKINHPSLSFFFEVHFRKPGYAPAQKQLDVNTPFGIQLQPKPISYIRVLGSKGKKIEGIIAQTGKGSGLSVPGPSDKFGFVQINIPPHLEGKKQAEIHLLGNQQFYDTTFQVNIAEMREGIIEITLRAKFQNYQEAKQQLLIAQRKVLQNPDNSDLTFDFMGQFEYLDKYKKTPKEAEDWKKTDARKIYDFLRKTSPDLPESWASKREEKIHEFKSLWFKLQDQKNLDEKFAGLDKLFVIGTAILDYDLEIRKAIGSNALWSDDYPVFKEMLVNELSLIDEALAKKLITQEVHQKRSKKINEKIAELEKRAI